jgi:hypothetical protein
MMIVAGADHFYAGMYGELWANVARGLGRAVPNVDGD